MLGNAAKIWNSTDRRYFIGGSDARIIVGDDEGAVLQRWREKRCKAEPEGLSGEDRASAKPSASPVCTAHAEFVAALAGHPPQTIPLDADAIDLGDRADHLAKVFGAFSVYVTVILDDTAQNVPGSLDLRDAEGLLADLASDVTGAAQHAAEGNGTEDQMRRRFNPADGPTGEVTWQFNRVSASLVCRPFRRDPCRGSATWRW